MPTACSTPLTADRLRRIAELQDRAARAVPAAVQEHRAGCWLRHTDSTTTWWAGATLMHGREPAPDLAAGIAAAEGFYADHGAPTRFQVCPACPPALDGELSRRGYQQDEVVSLQVATAARVAGLLPRLALRVDVDERPDRRWLHLLLAAQAPGADLPAEWRLLRRVASPSAYATAYLSGRAVAVGRAVTDSGWTGVFAMATLPGARRQGAAGAVLAGLVEWAVSQGSTHVYLQVTKNATAALRLYRRAGFEPMCTYHYRVAASVRAPRR